MDWYKYPVLSENDYATVYRGPGTDTPHFAADVQTPQGTPVTALLGGTVKQADYAPWGGEVFVDTVSPYDYRHLDWYVYHLDRVDVKVGQQLQPGDKIGISGGEPPVTNPKYSTGPHTHTGFFDYNYSGHTPSPGNYPVNHGWARVPGANGEHNITYGPDITPFLNTTKVGGLSTDPSTAISTAASNTFGFGAWFDGILSSMGVSDMSDLLYRALFVGVGLLLVIVGIVLLVKSIATRTVSSAIQG